MEVRRNERRQIQHAHAVEKNRPPGKEHQNNEAEFVARSWWGGPHLWGRHWLGRHGFLAFLLSSEISIPQNGRVIYITMILRSAIRGSQQYGSLPCTTRRFRISEKRHLVAAGGSFPLCFLQPLDFFASDVERRIGGGYACIDSDLQK